jgi:hypothetical protein
MPSADLRDWIFSTQTFQHYADFFLSSELTTGSFADLFDNIGGHGWLLLLMCHDQLRMD